MRRVQQIWITMLVAIRAIGHVCHRSITLKPRLKYRLLLLFQRLLRLEALGGITLIGQCGALLRIECHVPWFR